MVTEVIEQVNVTDSEDKITVGDTPDVVSVIDAPEGTIQVVDSTDNYNVLDSTDAVDVNDQIDQVANIVDAQIINTTQINQVATEIIQLTTGESIGTHKMVSIIGSTAWLADASTVSHADRVVGISIEPKTIGFPINIVVQGEITENSWSFTAGDPIYLSTSGDITQTVPTSGFLQNIGVALSPTKVLIDIDRPIMLH